MNESNPLAEYLPQIKRSRLFLNLKDEELPLALQFLHAQIRDFSRDEIILNLGDVFRYSGIVLRGTVEGCFINENYNKVNMNHFTSGRSFGEALACVQSNHSPIELRALEDCTVLFLEPHVLYETHDLQEAYQQRIALNLIQTLASQNVFSNLKLRIASQKALRDKILMYLYSLSPDKNGVLHIPFTQTALADFLGVNRSALSRELGRMMDEDVIQMPSRKEVILR